MLTPEDTTNIYFPHILSASFTARLIVTFIKHLLFMRGQIPCPFDQIENLILRGTNDQRNKQHRNSKTKKAKELITNFQILSETVMNTFQHIFTYQNYLDSLNLIILFGNTPMNPKEIYCLEFLNVCADSMLELDAQLEDSSERRLLRSLLGNLNEQDSLHATRLHLLIKTSRKNSPPELIPKQLLKFKFAKINTLFLVCEGLIGNSFSQDDELDDTEHESSDDDLIWYHFKTTLNGFPAI
ncbi:hypothetical protein F8M41_012884 [Gigaspora margarita]|uniref:Uncharacterized protein n=2 Tax=Gigaspora margarita TaxID=4874 RepID=A0A8H3ZZN3_GIGMA|nr:hypothetical protein F8M41_012884 [Gigaspora margarita]